MNLLTKERVTFVVLLLAALGYGVFVSFKILEDNTIMLVEKRKVENVETCINNQVACSLIYDSKEEIK